jgi:hypothetical protein
LQKDKFKVQLYSLLFMLQCQLLFALKWLRVLFQLPLQLHQHLHVLFQLPLQLHQHLHVLFQCPLRWQQNLIIIMAFFLILLLVLLAVLANLGMIYVQMALYSGV